jgi:hypothetical protein
MLKRLTVVCVAAAALSASATASAQHSYGVVINSAVPAGDADRGVAANIRTDTLVTANCSNFVDHEVWYGVVSGGGFWVEVGFTSGIKQDGGCANQAVFWADNRNGGGYHEHYPGNAWTLGLTYQSWIGAGSSSCSWTVNLGGVLLGTSTSNCPGTGRYLAGGIETTTTAAASKVKGFLGVFLRADSGGTWRNGWDSPGLSGNNPPSIQWTDSSNSVTEEVLNVAF